MIERDGKRELVPMRWGLVPSWWRKRQPIFNAHPSIAEKPMLHAAFKRNRCLIPASGHYEWKGTETGKQPSYFSTENGSPLTIAGLSDE